MINQILNQVEANTLKPIEAYNQIYQKQKHRTLKRRQAHFVKLSISIPESLGVTLLLKTLFMLPVPIVFVKPFIKKGFNKIQKDLEGFNEADLLELMATRHVQINVQSADGVKIKIYTL